MAPPLATASRRLATSRLTRRRASAGPADLDATGLELYELLRAKRLALARAAGLPPFMVFADRTLRDMAGQRPVTPEGLLEVSGVGRHKLAAYGEVKSQRAKLQFLEIKQVNDLAAVRKTMMKFISAVLTSASLLLISLGAFLQIRAKAISNSYSDLVRT